MPTPFDKRPAVPRAFSGIVNWLVQTLIADRVVKNGQGWTQTAEGWIWNPKAAASDIRTPWQLQAVATPESTTTIDVTLETAGGNVRTTPHDLGSAKTITDVGNTFTLADGEILYFELERTPPASITTATLTLKGGATPSYWPEAYDFDGDDRWTKLLYVLYEIVDLDVHTLSNDELRVSQVANGLAAIPRHPFAPLEARWGAYEVAAGDRTSVPVFYPPHGSCIYV